MSWESKLGKKLDTDMGQLREKEFDRMERVDRLDRAMRKYRPQLERKRRRQEKERKQEIFHNLREVKRPRGYETRKRKAFSKLDALMRGTDALKGLRIKGKELSRGTRLGLIREVIPYRSLKELAKKSAADPREEKFIKKDLLEIAKEESVMPQIIKSANKKRPTRKR